MLNIVLSLAKKNIVVSVIFNNYILVKIENK